MSDRASLFDALDELSGKLSSRPLTAAEAEDAVTLIFKARRALGIQDRGHHGGVHEGQIEFSLELACEALPPGYAIWTYGRYGEDGYDEIVLAKELGDVRCPLCEGFDFPGVSHSLGCPRAEANA